MTTTAKKTLKQIITEQLRKDCSMLQPGEKLPSEALLALRFDVNRHTVRAALSNLEDEGLIFRRRGMGSIITSKPTPYPIHRNSRFSQNIKKLGKAPNMQILRIEIEPVTEKVADILAINPKSQVYVLENIGFADQTPIFYNHAFFPIEQVANFDIYIQELKSITKAFKKSGIENYQRKWSKITTHMSNELQMHYLNLKDPQPLLRTESMNANDEGQPIQYAKTWFSGELVEILIDH